MLWSRRTLRWLKRLAILLMVVAVGFLGLAVSQFRLRREASHGTVILTMDVSKSMRATDVLPNRLEAAKTAARVFLDRLPAEIPVGLVTFADEAAVVVPPTTDRDRVVFALASLSLSEGTVIGDGLSAALDTLEAGWRESGKGPAAVVLLSDGLDTGSSVPPEQAAERAQSMAVRVFTVALGRAGAAGERSGANVGLLRQIAETTGGSTSTAYSAGELTQVYEGLGTQLSTELAISDRGALFVVIAAGFAIAAAVALMLAMRSEYSLTPSRSARRP